MNKPRYFKCNKTLTMYKRVSPSFVEGEVYETSSAVAYGSGFESLISITDPFHGVSSAGWLPHFTQVPLPYSPAMVSMIPGAH